MSHRARVLVVEDDQTLREGLVSVLEDAGFSVQAAIRGESALEIIRTSSPDLVVLDLMLPGLDGSYVLERARKEGFRAPVIILSARTSSEDKIFGLRAGADDYVTKPFDLQELLARIDVCLRRTRPVTTLRAGELALDVEARRATLSGKDLRLTPKEFDVLALFLANPDRALSRSRILEEVWGPDYRGTRRTVDNIVHGLRSKIEEDPERPRRLLTVRARGYRFSQGAR